MKQIKLNANVPVKDVVALVKNGKYNGIIFKYGNDEIVVKYTPFKQLISYFHPNTSLILSWHGDHLKIVSSVIVPKTDKCVHWAGNVSKNKVACPWCDADNPSCYYCKGMGYVITVNNRCELCAPQTECNGVYRIDNNAWLEGAPKMLGARTSALKIEMVN